MTAALAPGTTFAGYRVESLVARGGMGVVYRATDLSLQRPAALKLIAPELAEDERFRSRFLRESRLAASLDHASVVPVYEAGEQDGELYLAMRYVEGSDLKTLLRRDGRLAPERSVAILAQIASALDAAHRRGLVHRDVKPGNVLIDRDGHAYLTDFGVTKQVGGASTDTGRMVGTLDYLAPEQIRGEPVDARTDGYALACVLYECLAAAPPFHRETEGETLWAHMHEQFEPLPQHPALGSVLRKGLAKERDERYGSCVQLIEDARDALGLGPSPARRPRVSPSLARRRFAILAAGLIVLAGTIAAAIAALTTAGGLGPPPVGNGVAAIDPANGHIGSFTEAQTAPSNVAVGDGRVWVLNTEDHTISRIDPKTKKVVKFETGGHPSDVATGGGALWVGHSGRRSPRTTVSISRIDPKSTATTRTVRLPDTTGGAGGSPSEGYPRIAVGAGAVWAINPDYTVSRIDSATGRRVATIDAGARTIAAGREGVWFVGGDGRAVMRIDPRTNRVAETIPVGSDFLSGIAVGAGAVWVTAQQQGSLWRIEPGPRPIERTIDVGVGVSYVAFGDGAVWTANYVDGIVSRVDPRTNRVTVRTSVGATQALAAGAGSAWVSVAGGTRAGSLPASTCAAVASRGARQDVLIASDLPLQGAMDADDADLRGIADAIRFVLADHGFRAGDYVVGYQSCDDSTAQTGAFEARKCAANANAYARAARLVAVIGPYNSSCAKVEVPILNRAPGGPLALISPSNTHPNLTRGGRLSLPPPLGVRGEPDVYYPTGKRNYLRVIAREDFEGVALAMLANQRGLQAVYLLHDPADAGNVSWTDPFRRAASRLGVGIAGDQAYDARAASYRALADRVARSGADGVLIGGNPYSGADKLLRALRARLGPRATIMAGAEFAGIPDMLERAGQAARGLYVATSELVPDALDLSPAAKRFTRDFGAAAHGGHALQAAQATEVVLQAIKRSDGTRASVLQELQATRVTDGILGSFRFDRYGDITPAKITVLRITGHTPPSLRLPSYFEGAVVDRVLTVPASLAG
jgi:ABC-type branched-subunit amino acid transport system substrate-binding protein/streptogramin lyase